MKKWQLIDALGIKNSHEIINTYFLFVLSNTFGDGEYISSKDQKLCIFNLINKYSLVFNNSVKYITIPVIHRRNGIFYHLRFFYVAFVNLYYYLLGNKDVLMVLNNNNCISLMLLSVFSMIKKRKLLIMNHGELEMVGWGPKELKRSLSCFIYSHLTRVSFKLSGRSKYITHLVLGDYILENLHNIEVINKESFISWDHPFFYGDKCVSFNSSDLLDKKVIRIGFPGGWSIEKENLINQYNQKIPNQQKSIKIEFYFIGKSKRGVYMDREDYDKLLQQMDYLIYLYPNDSYQFTASGAIYDALIYEKPVLALHNACFNYLNNKYGRIGYLVNSVSELVNCLLELKDTSCFKICIGDFLHLYNKTMIVNDFKKKMLSVGLI